MASVNVETSRRTNLCVILYTGCAAQNLFNEAVAQNMTQVLMTLTCNMTLF